MKRRWIVVVSEGIGHEYNNTISESEFFGPYTKEMATELEEKLNTLFSERKTSADANRIAQALPLVNCSPSSVCKNFEQERPRV